MSTFSLDRSAAATSGPADGQAHRTLTRVSARFGVAFAICQIGVMVLMATLVLPHGGSPSDPPLQRGQHVLDAETLYQVGNYVFMIAGSLLLGFIGVVQVRMRRVDPSGVLATVAVAAGTLLAVVWPMAGMLHDVALETASSGTDLRILAGWDSVAPFALAFSVLPRLFFIGALVLGLRLAGTAPWLQRIGVVLLPVSLIGSATLVSGALFPVLALSTLGFELWVGALAWHWLRVAE
ncbi:MAG TPA: hypothetical protein VH419_13120 [Nocardioidaceae bacterium]